MILNDIEIYFSPYSSSCQNCKYFKSLRFKCKAFPKEIPIEILSGDNKHLKPLPEQGNDIVFEPKRI